MKDTLNLSATTEDADLIRRIVDRADELYSLRDRLSLHMDLTACHLNGCPLDLDKLLGADDIIFGHDVLGINTYINRATGRLYDHFLPRCAKPVGGAA